MSGPEPGSLRVGVDLVPIEQVADSVRAFGERYVQRIYTEHERSVCRRRRPGGVVPADAAEGWACDSLAARFAAKEAVVKVLRPSADRPEWRSIEVHRMAAGWCEIRLTGRAAALAEAEGITEFAVSLTHEPPVAAAVVVGRRTVAERGVR